MQSGSNSLAFYWNVFSPSYLEKSQSVSEEYCAIYTRQDGIIAGQIFQSKNINFLSRDYNVRYPQETEVWVHRQDSARLTTETMYLITPLVNVVLYMRFIISQQLRVNCTWQCNILSPLSLTDLAVACPSTGIHKSESGVLCYPAGVTNRILPS